MGERLDDHNAHVSLEDGEIPLLRVLLGDDR